MVTDGEAARAFSGRGCGEEGAQAAKLRQDMRPKIRQGQGFAETHPVPLKRNEPPTAGNVNLGY